MKLLQHACRITLFTRANCSLCTKAKQTLSSVWDVRPFEFKEIDVMKLEEKNWRDLYEYDTPVVSDGPECTREYGINSI
jgi:glutaredoxin